MNLDVSPEVLRLRAATSSNPLRVLALHAYSQSPASLLPLAIGVGLPQIEWIIPALPGHGELKNELNLSTVLSSLSRWREEYRPGFVVGFSLGARLALACTNLPCVAISPPMIPTFERADRDELLTFLNPRRVKESKPMGGLAEVLGGLPSATRTAPAKVFYGQKDLRSVREGVTRFAETSLIAVQELRHCNHGDICQAPELISALRGALT